MAKSMVTSGETPQQAGVAESYFYARSHRQAYERLIDAIKRETGFFVLIGEAGMGKTAFMEYVGRELPEELGWLSFTAPGPGLSVEDFIGQLSERFKAECEDGANGGQGFSEASSELSRGLGVPASRLLANVSARFFDRLQLEKPLLVLIDDAHQMSPTTLRTFVQLAELRNSDQGELFFVLAGLGELRELVNARVAGSELTVYELEPLESDEIPEYIRTRFAGHVSGNGASHLDIKSIASSTKGNPASINATCQSLLVAATSTVDSDTGVQLKSGVKSQVETGDDVSDVLEIGKAHRADQSLKEFVSETKQRLQDERQHKDASDASSSIASIKRQIKELAIKVKTHHDWETTQQLEMILSVDPENRTARATLAELQHKVASASKTGRRKVAMAAAAGLILLAGVGLVLHQGHERGFIGTPQTADTSTGQTQSTDQLMGILSDGNEGSVVEDGADNASRAQGTKAEINRLLALAEEQFAQGRLMEPAGDNALGSYRAVLGYEPGHVQALAGMKRIKATYLERARNQLEAVLAIDEGDEVAQSTLAEVVQAQETAAEINRLLALAEEQFTQGQLMEPEGDNALASYREVLAVEPDEEMALVGIERIKAVYLQRGVEAQAGQDWARARTELGQVLVIDEGDTLAQNTLAAVAQAQETEAEINRLLALAKEQFAQGQLMAPEGDNALASYREILAVEADQVDALAGVGRIRAVYVQRGLEAQAARDWATARGELEAALEIDSTDELAQNTLVEVAQAQETAAEINRMLALAEEQFTQGQWMEPAGDNALASYREILAVEPDQEMALAGIERIKAVYWERAGQARSGASWVTARSELEAVLAIDAGDEAAQSALAEVVQARETRVERIKAVYLRRGVEAQAAGDWTKARSELGQVLAIDPTHEVAQSTLAEVVQAQETAAEIERLLALAEEQVTQGQLMEPEGDNALASYRQVLAVEPDQEMALAGVERIKAVYLQRGVEAQTAQDWTTARSELGQVLAIDEGDETAQSVLAQVIEAQETEAEINRLLALAEEQFTQGQLMEPAGDNALGSYREVLAVESDQEMALAGVERIKAVYMQRGVEAQAAGDLETARGELEAVLAIDPPHEVAQSTLAQVIEAQETAAEINRLLALADEQFTQGQLMEPAGDNALGSYRNVLTVEPEQAAALAGVERIKAVYLQRSMEAQAAQDWETARSELGQVLAIDEGDETAQSVLTQVIEAQETEAEINRLLALAEEQFTQGQLMEPAGDNALGSYREVLAVKPDQEMALAGVERIKAVYLERARSQLEAVLAIDKTDGAAQAALVEVLQGEDIEQNASLEETDSQSGDESAENIETTQAALTEVPESEDIEKEASLEATDSQPVEESEEDIETTRAALAEMLQAEDIEKEASVEATDSQPVEESQEDISEDVQTEDADLVSELQRLLSN